MPEALPVEVIDHILGWVAHRRDLLNFACASRACEALAIPKHTEYRILRVSGGIDQWQSTNFGYIDVWDHLARRPDLTSNIRVLHFIQQENPRPFQYFYPRLRIPTQLLESIVTTPNARPCISAFNWREEDAKEQFEAICSAVVWMDKLETFMWGKVEGYTAISWDNERLLELVAQKSTLRLLQLGDDPCLDAFMDSLDNLEHSLWSMPNLGGLIFGYPSDDTDDYELSAKQHSYFAPWMRSLSSLTFLEITVEIFAAHSGSIHLPSLKRLSLFGERHNDLASNNHIGAFFINHPQIEEFSWNAWGTVVTTLPPGCLPNLRRLACPDVFLWALNAATWFVGPYSTPRKIEEISLSRDMRRRTSIEHLVQARAFDHLSLKCLRITSPAAESLDALFALPRVFPNITHLDLSSDLRSIHRASEKKLSQDEWLHLLSEFPNLEVFLGHGIWEDYFDYIPKASDLQIVQVVERFARRCHKLRKLRCPIELPLHGDDDDEVSANHEVVISREDARSCRESTFMLNWLGKDSDRVIRWKLHWEVVEPPHIDPFNMRWGDIQ